MQKLTLFLLAGLLLTLLVGPAVAQDVDLVPFTNETFGIEGVIPDGWTEVGNGVYSRDQATVLAVQAAPVGQDDLLTALLPQLGLAEAPESSGTYETAYLTWTLYEVEVSAASVTIKVDLGLAEFEGSTAVVLLQTNAETYDVDHAAIFWPVLDALKPIGAEGAADEDIFVSEDGRFSVPIPTNWTTEQAENYTILRAPDDELVLYIAVFETDDMEAAIADAWALVNAERELVEDDSNYIEDEAALGDYEAVLVINYESEDDETFFQGAGFLYQGETYVILAEGTIQAATRRAAQLNIINTGFKITAIEDENLTGVEPKIVDDALIANLERYIVEVMGAYNVQGLSIAIVQDGEIVYLNGFGVTEAGGDPVDGDTLFMTGSSGKSMTTMMMGTLVDDGLMTWETPVVEIMPEFVFSDAETTETILVKHLVCACTGVPRRDMELIFNGNDLTAESIVESLATFELFTDFGEAFQYSNQMVATGGYVAAEAAGYEFGNLYDGYTTLMQERIFGPIGMERSTLSMDAVEDMGNYAKPHIFDLGFNYTVLPLSAEAFLNPVAPAGAHWSTAADMGRYLITHLAEGVAPNGERVISVENLRRTWEPQVALSAESSYGLGWIIDAYKGLPLLHHGGNTLGFTTDMAFLPDAGVGIVVMTNQRGSLVNAAIRFYLFELLFEQEHEYDAQIAFAFRSQQDAIADIAEHFRETDPGQVEAYLGPFSNDALGEITLTLENNNILTLDAGEFKTELRRYVNDDGEESYLAFDPPLTGGAFELMEDDDGNPTITFQEYTFEKVE